MTLESKFISKFATGLGVKGVVIWGIFESGMTVEPL